MPLKIKPDDLVLKGLGLETGGPIHAFFTAECARYMDRYVPFDSGTLAETVIINGQPTSNVTVDTITYAQPYATYQWRGMREDGSHKINEANRSRDKHPDATSNWVEKMWSAHKEDIVKSIKTEMKRRGVQQ